MNELDIRWESFQYHTENKQDTFEELCRRLFTAKYLKNTVVPHTDPNSAGIEVHPVLEPAREDGKPSQYISFQSKYTETLSSAYTKFKDSAEKTIENFSGRLGRVYLFSNQMLSTLNTRYKKTVNILSNAGIEAVLVCGSDLLDLIREYQTIANDYFPAKTVRYSGKDMHSEVYLNNIMYVPYITENERDYKKLLQTIYEVYKEKDSIGPIPDKEWLIGGNSIIVHQMINNQTEFKNANESMKTEEIPDFVGKENISKVFNNVTIQVGDRDVLFGKYPQGIKIKPKPLYWRVLAVDEKSKKALLITEDLIECRRYHINDNSTWEECELREWLNGEFFFTAFSKEEREKIDRTVNDKVFLLTLNEARKYFENDKDRIAEVTPYALNQYRQYKNHEMPMGWWWLRSLDVGRKAPRIGPRGGIDESGHDNKDTHVAVRPALWLNL